MKDIMIRTLKGSYGLLPERSKQKLRNFHRLREWYAGRLRRSSIAYETPSLRTLRQCWAKLYSHQVDTLSKQKLPAEPALNVVIHGEKDVSVTLRSLSSISHRIVSVYVQSNTVPTNEDAEWSVKHYTQPSEIQFSGPDTQVLVIAAGNRLIAETANSLLSLCSHNDVCYFDSVTLDDKERLVDYAFLPAWNPELLISAGYINNAILLKNASNMATWQSQDDIASFVLRLYVENPQLKVKHLPYTLTSSVDAFRADATSRASVLEATQAVGHTINLTVQALWPLSGTPLISLIIPTFNGHSLVKACIESILDKTTYPNYEILLVDNNSNDPECLAYFDELDKHPKVRLLKYPHPFNYSAINNFAVKHAKGEIIGLVNNDIEVITPNWLEYMAGHAMREDIGCVGAKLLYTDGRIQHAGVVLGYGNGAGHAHKYFPRHHPGYMNRLIATQNYSAVTAACLLVKKSKFEEVGGLNEEDLQVAFNDVDFCLKVLETGVRNVYCAEAELFHHESVSRGLDITEEKAARFNRELEYLRTTWKKYIDNDPAYNPNLTRKRENFSIKFKEEY